MCGFIAQLDPLAGDKHAALRSALAALRHRGPDGEDIWCSADGNVALGHARLAVIGLNNGSQPIANEDESIHAVVNGEFYDFERIRAELQNQGHRFRTESDSEIVIHLYEEYGSGCLQFLRGEFAFVLWDENKRQLFAARDRFGIKPLVYALHNGGIILASEAKALFAAGVPARWDEESFFDACNLQYVMPERTLFGGVFQLLPGHYLIAGEDGRVLTTQKYWDLNYSEEADDLRAFSQRQQVETVETFRDRLKTAVHMRLRADIPVCCHLSGGMDSSSIVALAAQYASSPVQCFSVTFNEESYDELQVAARMARHANAVLHPVPVSQSDIIEHLADAVYFSEGLAVNGHLPAKYLLHKEIRRQGFKVALTGEGSDEALAGYAHLRADLFAARGRNDLIAALGQGNSVSKGIMLKHGQSLPLTAVEECLSFVPNFLQAKGTLGFKLNSVLSGEYRGQFAGVDCYERLLMRLDIERQLKGKHRVNQSLYLWTKTALANYILRTLGDGTEMAHSIEGRVPFLDHELFEYASRLPLEMKINGSTEKFVLREAMNGLVTDEIYSRQKHPFVAPPLSLFTDGRSADLLHDELSSADFASIPFFDQRKILDLLEKMPGMPADTASANDPVFMTALSALALKRRFALGS